MTVQNPTTIKEHLKRIINNFVDLISQKYIRGAVEHGGSLWEKKDLIGKAKEEVVDLYSYLDALEIQLDKLEKEHGIVLGTQEDEDEK